MDLETDSSLALEALERRAIQAEYRLHSFRQHRSARTRALNEFIKARAPELWDDYCAVAVNGSLYSEQYAQEPVYERELNIAQHRAEAAEQKNTELRAALVTACTALEFYADPEVYHGCAFLFDGPTGGFDEDFGPEEEHGHSDYLRPMPGKQARAALAEITAAKL